MRHIWIHELRVMTPNGKGYVRSTYALTNQEYALPECRAEAERRNEAQLRHTEGVSPTWPIQNLGWR